MARTSWVASAPAALSRFSFVTVFVVIATAASVVVGLRPGTEAGSGFEMKSEPTTTTTDGEEEREASTSDDGGQPVAQLLPFIDETTGNPAGFESEDAAGSNLASVPDRNGPTTSTVQQDAWAPHPTAPSTEQSEPAVDSPTSTGPTTTASPTTTTPTTAPPSTTSPTTATPTTAAPTSAPPPTGLTPSGPIELRNQVNVVLENLHVTNPNGNCITIFDSSNVTIRNSVIGPCGGDAVYGIRVTNGLVENLQIADVGRGVIFVRSDTVKVQDNTLTNAGSYFVQFNNVNGGGNRILRNRGQNDLGASGALDMISLFASNGQPADPIQVIGNYIRGGGPSTIGSGIMTGDNGGSHQLVKDNVLVNPGQAGIGVSGGHDISVVDNRLYSATHPWGNVGIAAFNHREFPCYNIEVSGNQVKWTNKNDYPNPWWTDGHCGTIDGLGSNNFYADLSPSIW